MMTKDSSNSFWLSPPPLDDLAKIQEYIKPRHPLEVLKLLAPAPPLPPSVEKEELQHLGPEPDPVRDELADLYGITPEEFVRSAIEEPELWTDEQLERLHAVLSGDLAPQSIVDIVSEHLHAGGPRKAKQPVAFRTHEPTEEEDDLSDLSDIVSDHLEAPRQPPPGPELDMTNFQDVGEWWSNRRK